MTPRQPIRDHISRVLGANSLLETGNMGFGMRASIWSRIPIASFPFPGKRGHLLFRPLFRGSSSATRIRASFKVARFQGFKEAKRLDREIPETLKLRNLETFKKASSNMSHYELRCRECGRTWGNQPRSICDDCFSPLEVAYDYDALRGVCSVVSGSPSGRRTCGATPNCCPSPRALNRGCRSASLHCCRLHASRSS